MKHSILILLWCMSTTVFARYSPPLFFEKNSGQFESEVQYALRSNNYAVTIGHLGFSLISPLKNTTIDVKFIGASTNKFHFNLSPNASRNYFFTSRKDEHIKNIDLHEKIYLSNVYEGIDIEYYLKNGELEFDAILQPHSNISKLRLSFNQASLVINKKGELILENNITWSAPISFQIINGKKVNIKSSYKIGDDNTVSFQLGKYNPDYKVIIDPIISFSSYLGGSLDDHSFKTVLKDGYLYVAGTTTSPDLPLLSSYQTSFINRTAFIEKFSLSNGTPELVYSTLIGTDVAELRGLAVDDSGNAYITGSTSALNFPVKNAIQTVNAGLIDLFITKINSLGNDIIFSTYLGGNSIDRGRDLKIDSSNAIYVTGVTVSTDFPVSNAWQDTPGGSLDAILLKLSSNGSSLIYSTYYGGTGFDYGQSVSISNTGEAVITGTSNSSDLPVLTNIQGILTGDYDAYFAKFNQSGQLTHSDYLGGSNYDAGTAIGYSLNGAIIVYGQTQSNNFPSTLGDNFSVSEPFITKINLVETRYNFSRLIGGSGSEAAWDMAIDKHNVAHTVGITSSTDFPNILATQTTKSGSSDGFISSISLDDGRTLYSDYIGGSANETARGVSKENGLLAITGSTNSNDLPLHNAYQANNAGNGESFIMLIKMDRDEDTIDDYFDNCPDIKNATQLDTDNDNKGNICDSDDDNDGLSDTFEDAIGTSRLLADTDGDTLSDYDEISYGGNPNIYNPNIDLNPLSQDTDGDTLADAIDPIPLIFNFNDGDLAPLGAPDGIINIADYLISIRLSLGLELTSVIQLSHGDLYPENTPDGVIDFRDTLLQMQLMK